jgi:hypothetical protein
MCVAERWKNKWEEEKDEEKCPISPAPPPPIK